MKRLLFLMVLLFAMIVGTPATMAEGFNAVSYETPSGYSVLITDNVQSDMSIMNDKSDKHQMSYAQVNCDRCHSDDLVFESAINSVNDNSYSNRVLAVRSLDHRYRF